jgi:hypothetical protein
LAFGDTKVNTSSGASDALDAGVLKIEDGVQAFLGKCKDAALLLIGGSDHPDKLLQLLADCSAAECKGPLLGIDKLQISVECNCTGTVTRTIGRVHVLSNFALLMHVMTSYLCVAFLLLYHADGVRTHVVTVATIRDRPTKPIVFAQGTTLMHLAFFFNRPKCAQALATSCKASAWQKDFQFQTPARLAARSLNWNLIQMALYPSDPSCLTACHLISSDVSQRFEFRLDLLLASCSLIA